MVNTITIVGTIIGILAVFPLCYRLYKWIYNKGFQDALKPRKTEQLSKLYAPLRRELLNTHLISVSGIRYPFIKQRLKRSWREIYLCHFIKGAKLLFDKGKTKPDIGVEYGYFPIDKINKILKENIELADSKLIMLIQQRERDIMENATPFVSNQNGKDH